MKTLAIIPAWNEQDSVGSVIADIRQHHPLLDIVVIDDGSTDATAERAREAGAVVLSLPFNMGVGAALRTGFRYAVSIGADRVIQVDADGQHDPAAIADVLAGLERAHISIGARFADVGAYQVRGPRRWAMVLLARVLSSLARTRLTDVTSGFRAADRVAVDQYLRYFPAEYLGDTVESLVAALQNGLTVTQVPVAMRPRETGRPSQDVVRSTLYLARCIVALVVGLLRGTRMRAEVGA